MQASDLKWVIIRSSLLQWDWGCGDVAEKKKRIGREKRAKGKKKKNNTVESKTEKGNVMLLLHRTDAWCC
jgi:hypothetical protein